MKNNADIINWAINWLKAKEYTLQQAPETLLQTPWSNVIRFATTTEDFYLKQTSPPIYIEAEIIELLAQRFHTNVAELVATNADLHCFLMQDAGPSLRKYLKTNFVPKLLFQAIEQFAIMQRATENDLQAFLALGVPDWRLDKLPELYLEIINQSDLLLANDLTKDELQILQALHVTVVQQCSLLSEYQIPETIVQPDCNTNNILFNPITNELTIIDLGEIALAHPFLSLNNFLYQATLHEGIKEQDPIFNKIQATYLDIWLGVAPKSQLLEIMQIIDKIHPIYDLLFHYRLLLSVDPRDYKLFYSNKPNQLAKHFRLYIKKNT